MKHSRIWSRMALALLTSLTLGGALAQSYPAKPITLVVPYPAGGPSDYLARKIQTDAAKDLGQTIIIENIGGAGGSIGMTKLINAAPDGYMAALGTPMDLTLAPLAIQSVKFKSEDFKLVALVVSTNMILVTRSTLEVRNADKPLSYGSVGPGSLYHLIGEKFAQLTGTNLLHVPYKGVAPLLNDLMGGQIDMAFLPMAGSIMQTVADGAVYASLQNPEVRKDLEATGNAVMSPRSPAELATLYQQETERYRALAKSINLQPQAQ